ncbi:MAG: hypothetical protein MI919_01020, partial [Holophagales bacterium]|nr:hypothetical protein [Holophagales bacterium]
SPWSAPWLEEGAAPEPYREALGEPLRGPIAGPLARIGLALVERRVGFVPYFPVALLVLALAWRGRRRWSVADRTMLAALAFLVLAQPWIADRNAGELLSNPGLVALYPLFFLLPRERPGRIALPAAAAVAMVLLGPAWISALGPAMAFGDAQGHTRSPLLSRLPLDLGHVGRGDGYRPRDLGRVSADPRASPVRLWIPDHSAEVHGDEVWLLGGTRTELFLEAGAPLGPTRWRARNLAPGNRAKLELAGETARFHWPSDLGPAGDSTAAHFELGEGALVETRHGPRHVWRLRVETRAGERPAWRRGAGEDFYLGLGLVLLGTDGHLERDVYGVRWAACEAPAEVRPEEELLALGRLVNASAEVWNHTGAARIRLSHRWRTPDGSLVAEGERTDLPRPIAPGEELVAWSKARAPSQPGEYQLVLEMIYENVDWFGQRRPESVCRSAVRVAPPAAP